VTEQTIESTFLQNARSRLCVHLTRQIQECLNGLQLEQIWWRPNEASNAIGNLVLHCIGSTRFYIGHVIGNSNFVRNRDTEFSERRSHPTAELLAHLNIAIEEADDVLSHLDPATLLTPAERALKPAIVMDIISLQVTHYALHVGQIAYATKLLNANAIDEVWRKTQP
jgi:hypothetical protein